MRFPPSPAIFFGRLSRRSPLPFGSLDMQHSPPPQASSASPRRAELPELRWQPVGRQNVNWVNLIGLCGCVLFMAAVGFIGLVYVWRSGGAP